MTLLRRENETLGRRQWEKEEAKTDLVEHKLDAPGFWIWLCNADRKKTAAVQVSELLEGRKRNDCQAGKTLRTCEEVESHSEETVLFQLVSAKD